MVVDWSSHFLFILSFLLTQSKWCYRFHNIQWKTWFYALHTPSYSTLQKFFRSNFSSGNLQEFKNPMYTGLICFSWFHPCHFEISRLVMLLKWMNSGATNILFILGYLATWNVRITCGLEEIHHCAKMATYVWNVPVRFAWNSSWQRMAWTGISPETNRDIL